MRKNWQLKNWNIIDKKYYPKLLNLITKYEDNYYVSNHTHINNCKIWFQTFIHFKQKNSIMAILFDKKISKIKGLKR